MYLRGVFFYTLNKIHETARNHTKLYEIVFLIAPKSVRDWSGILFLRRRRRSGKRYSGKPDGGAGSGAGTPKERRLQVNKTT
jgi:hypothetical protein